LWRDDGQNPAVSVPGGWLTAEGPIAEANTELGRALGLDFGAEPYCWYFYFSDTNAFLYWAAQDVAFEWQGSAQPAA
jgi:hypothetical protein